MSSAPLKVKTIAHLTTQADRNTTNQSRPQAAYTTCCADQRKVSVVLACTAQKPCHVCAQLAPVPGAQQDTSGTGLKAGMTGLTRMGQGSDCSDD